ncbi:MAG TPA: four helix bundle protein [Rhodothermales bacterium]|nr:four helix bundle protein [Rhodothermales bacterium]
MVKQFRDLRVYQQAFQAAQTIYTASRAWPREEKYALTDQIRRSSRSVCANTAEAWRKRRYPKHFITKLSDADAEAAETQSWLDFARECGYLSPDEFNILNSTYEVIIGGLVNMMASPDRWCGPSIIREEGTIYRLDDTAD